MGSGSGDWAGANAMLLPGVARRGGGDSNPRGLLTLLVFETSAFDHSATSPWA